MYHLLGSWFPQLMYHLPGRWFPQFTQESCLRPCTRRSVCGHWKHALPLSFLQLKRTLSMCVHDMFMWVHRPRHTGGQLCAVRFSFPPLLNVGSGNQNSGPHAGTACSLSPEPSSQSSVRAYLSVITYTCLRAESPPHQCHKS